MFGSVAETFAIVFIHKIIATIRHCNRKTLSLCHETFKYERALSEKASAHDLLMYLYTPTKAYYGCFTPFILYQPMYPVFVVCIRRAKDACLHNSKIKRLPKSSSWMSDFKALLVQNERNRIFIHCTISSYLNTFIHVSVSYLSEKGLVNLHSLVRALRQDLSPAVPAVADGRVGVGHAAQKHCPLIVELFLSFSYTLVHRHRRFIKV